MRIRGTAYPIGLYCLFYTSLGLTIQCGTQPTSFEENVRTTTSADAQSTETAVTSEEACDNESFSCSIEPGGNQYTNSSNNPETDPSLESSAEDHNSRLEADPNMDPSNDSLTAMNSENPDNSTGVNSYRLITVELSQTINNKVDILWVVDSSGSMKEEQGFLAENFDSFISNISMSQMNFRTAVTSSDSCNENRANLPLSEIRCPTGGSTFTNGSFFTGGGEQVLSNTTDNLISKFNEMAQVGINGSGFEHGLKSAELAIEKSLNNQNSSLVREDAFLAVIVVSDEEDDGIGLSQTDFYSGKNFFELGLTEFKYTEDDFIQYLSSVKGENNFAVSAITGLRKPNGELCTSEHSQPKEEGTQYIKAAQKTGGMIKSICEANWGQLLEDIGLDITAQIKQIALEHEPVPDSIKVYVNDMENMQWSYSTSNHSIKFDANAIPENGDSIRIEYLTAK